MCIRRHLKRRSVLLAASSFVHSALSRSMIVRIGPVPVGDPFDSTPSPGEPGFASFDSVVRRIGSQIRLVIVMDDSMQNDRTCN